MRVCFFCSKVDRDLLENSHLLGKIHPSLGSAKEEDIYWTTYRLPSAALEARNLYYPWGQHSLRMTLCRRFFRLIDTSPWVPPFLAWIPLSFCKEEIIDLLLGCDPDVVVLSDIRWAKQLQAFLQEQFPFWTYVTRNRQMVEVNGQWRQLDTSTKVSIVLPTYNGSRYLRRSLESCLRQTFENIEVIVVDDGSAKDIRGIVSDYKDARLRYVSHEANRGLPQALNTGFSNATGAYLTWTSDDNYYTDNAIEEMVRFLQTYPQIEFIYSDYFVMDGAGTIPEGRIRRTQAPASLKENNFIGPCFLYTRRVYEAVGEYDSAAFLAEDYDYWVRVSKQFKMQRLFRPMYYYQLHENSLTSKYSTSEIQEKVREVKDLHSIRTT